MGEPATDQCLPQLAGRECDRVWSGMDGGTIRDDGGFIRGERPAARPIDLPSKPLRRPSKPIGRTRVTRLRHILLRRAVRGRTVLGDATLPVTVDAAWGRSRLGRFIGHGKTAQVKTKKRTCRQRNPNSKKGLRCRQTFRSLLPRDAIPTERAG